ncbi:hypothetical protein REPUB_Repub13aG0096000 [Reevesia pubescens]
MGKSCLGNKCILEINLLVYFIIIILSLLPGISLKFALALGNRTDRLALLSLKHQLVGGYPGALSSWNASHHFCEWQGVTCCRRHQRVTALELTGFKLVGSLSPSIGNLTFLRRLNLSDNRLQGNIPKEVGYLRRLRVLELSHNFLHGKIPIELANCSNLLGIVLLYNNLTGEVPVQLGDLSKLVRLSLGVNKLVGGIPSLGNLSSLLHLSLSSNHLEVNIPYALGRALNLRYLFLGSNNLSGTLPLSVHNLSSLEMIEMATNNFSGSLATEIFRRDWQSCAPNCSQHAAECPDHRHHSNFHREASKSSNIESHFDNFSGEIPPFIGNLSHLFRLNLRNNNFEGRIPLALENCKNMQILALGRDKLSGSIPDQLFGGFTGLFFFNVSYNSLAGPLPSEFGDLKNLVRLIVNDNKLSGEIPKELGSCSGLFTLDMVGNFFQGSIPLSFGSLKSLQALNLSRNNLSGRIPHELEKLTFLSSLNLSFNHLEGEVPKAGVFNKSGGFSIMGNENLCGGIPEIKLPKCLNQDPRKKGIALSAKVIIVMILGILTALILLVLLLALYCRQRSRKKLIPAALFGDGYLRVSYNELHQATGGFASSSLIGVGSFGSVYKGYLHQQEKPVAIKVLNLQNRGAAKSFTAECKALKKVRHQNLLKIITSCSSIDYQSNDFKALVFEFIPNGSLDNWLHEIDIAIDVANAIDYLHHDCETVIVHCDLKPTNVLLDDDMVAHVSDFGLAKLLSSDIDHMANDQTSSLIIKGTIGYVAPEYGTGGAVSPEGDIYSYGIVLLEMITGRRPTDDMFHGGLSLHNFCKMALPEGLKEILDFRLVEEVDENNQRLRNRPNMEGEIWDCLVSFTKIGVACSSEVPGERMGIKDAIRELQATKARLLRIGSNM